MKCKLCGKEYNEVEFKILENSPEGKNHLSITGNVCCWKSEIGDRTIETKFDIKRLNKGYCWECQDKREEKIKELLK